VRLAYVTLGNYAMKKVLLSIKADVDKIEEKGGAEGNGGDGIAQATNAIFTNAHTRVVVSYFFTERCFLMSLYKKHNLHIYACLCECDVYVCDVCECECVSELQQNEPGYICTRASSSSTSSSPSTSWSQLLDRLC